MDVVMFYLAAFVTLVGAVMVLVLKNPLRAALALILSLGGLALVYVLLHAQFVAVMQLLVYAGAILVLFVFVIMLLNLEDPPGKGRGLPWVAGALVLLGGGAAVLARVLALKDTAFSKGDSPVVNALQKDFGSVEQIGMQIMTDFVLPFEMLSVLLLVAVVGAVVISKKRL
jgi:NADH-quinone oxidoreductase subunit J